MGNKIIQKAMSVINTSDGAQSQKAGESVIFNSFGLLPCDKPVLNAFESDLFDWNCVSTEDRETLFKYYQKLPNVKKGFFLYGPAGTGKTTVAVNIGNELTRKLSIEKGRQWKPIRAYPWFKLSEAIKTFPKDRTQEQESMIYNLKKGYVPELIIFDDFAAGSMSNTVQDDIEFIIRRLEMKGANVIFTGNIIPQIITKIFNEQLFSRIASMTVIIEFNGEDWRNK